MNNIKILITGIEAIDKSIIAKRLVEIDDSLTIIPHFTSNIDMKDNISEFEYFLDNHTIHLAYKNNSIMTVYTNNYTSNGITIDDFYNNDICYMTIEQFNLISDKFINENNILVIWLDESNNHKISKDEIAEINYMQERLNNMKYLYFLNDSHKKICNVILEYLNSDEDRQQQLLEEYS